VIILYPEKDEYDGGISNQQKVIICLPFS